MPNDAAATPAIADAEKTRVHTASSAIKDGVLTFTFGPPASPTGSLSVAVADVKASKVEGLADEYIMVGVAMDIRSAYSSARGDGAKALELAQKRLATILSEGRGVVAAGEGETSAFTTAVEVMAEHRGKPVDAIMAVINGWADQPLYKLVADGKVVRKVPEGAESVVAINDDGTPAHYTVADQRREFVARVKSDPATMAAYAAKRAAAMKPKAQDAFAEF